MRDYTELQEFLSTGPKTPKEIGDYFGLDKMDLNNLTRRAVANSQVPVDSVQLPRTLIYTPTWRRSALTKLPVRDYFLQAPRGLYVAGSVLGGTVKLVEYVITYYVEKLAQEGTTNNIAQLKAVLQKALDLLNNNNNPEDYEDSD